MRPYHNSCSAFVSVFILSINLSSFFLTPVNGFTSESHWLASTNQGRGGGMIRSIQAQSAPKKHSQRQQPTSASAAGEAKACLCRLGAVQSRHAFQLNVSQSAEQPIPSFSNDDTRHKTFPMNAVTDIPTATTVAPTLSDASSSRQLPIWQLAFAGSLTTFCTDILMHPMDSIKTLQQSDVGVGLDLSMIQAATYLMMQPSTATSLAVMDGSGGQTAAVTVPVGLAGLYHGFLIYASSDAIGGALKFSVWEMWKRQFVDRTQGANDDDDDDREDTDNNNSNNNMPVLQLGMGAALAFVASSVVIVPGEFLKNQLQMSHYDGVLEAIQGIAAGASGWKGFYTGYEGVLYRDIPYTMLELGLYEVIKSFIDTNNTNKSKIKAQEQEVLLAVSSLPVSGEAPATLSGQNPTDLNQETSTGTTSSSLETIAAAAVTGAITAFLTTPLDTVKTKLMVDDYDGASFLQCFAATVEHHGWPSVFAGVVARVVWVVPFTAVYLPTYDFLKNQLWRRHAGIQQRLDDGAATGEDDNRQ